MGTSYAMGGPLVAGGNREKGTLPGPDDKIIAIEYLQVNLRRHVGECTSSDERAAEYIDGEVMTDINVEDVLEVFGTAIEDGRGSIIVTPPDPE